MLKNTEYRPHAREQKAWTQGSYGDESREFRAFDTLRDDNARNNRTKPKGPRGPKRPGAKSDARH